MRQCRQLVNKALQGYKYLFLLILLLCLLTLHPLLEYHPLTREIFSMMVSALLLTSILFLTRQRRWMYFGFLFAMSEVACIWWHYFSRDLLSEVFKFIFFVLFHLYAIVCVYQDLANTRQITADEVRGAICLYIFIGATWSAVYYLLEMLAPGSFHVTTYGQIDQHITWYDLLYFSFTTLSSVGYGDITAVAPVARALAIFESIAGIFYVAVIVAKMVSQFIQASQSPRIQD